MLDHISRGRIGGNVVTSANITEAYNFGRAEHYQHGDRYERALEFVEVVRRLWDSREDDALLRHRANAVYFVVTKLQDRGLLRTEYDGTTLRDHLGLPRPASRDAAAGSQAAE